MRQERTDAHGVGPSKSRGLCAWPRGSVPPCPRDWCSQAWCPVRGYPHRPLVCLRGLQQPPEAQGSSPAASLSSSREPGSTGAAKALNSCPNPRGGPGGRGASPSLAAAGRVPARRPIWEPGSRERPRGLPANASAARPSAPLLAGDSLAGRASGHLQAEPRHNRRPNEATFSSAREREGDTSVLFPPPSPGELGRQRAGGHTLSGPQCSAPGHMGGRPRVQDPSVGPALVLASAAC